MTKLRNFNTRVSVTHRSQSGVISDLVKWSAKHVFIGGCGTTIDKEHKDIVTVVARISSIFRRDFGV